MPSSLRHGSTSPEPIGFYVCPSSLHKEGNGGNKNRKKQFSLSPFFRTQHSVRMVIAINIIAVFAIAIRRNSFTLLMRAAPK